ncbi:RNA-binding protein 6 isoform X2 [Bombina bombina]|uniref:RNA-binding protein 6 isoform X2 n=1 Tax=Bombina bombina TaxID=8345 RepID=UPI00235A4DC4|nr:RNA-binding protein 6 isoform X2 [Bombina bombina]
MDARPPFPGFRGRPDKSFHSMRMMHNFHPSHRGQGSGSPFPFHDPVLDHSGRRGGPWDYRSPERHAEEEEMAYRHREMLNSDYGANRERRASHLDERPPWHTNLNYDEGESSHLYRPRLPHSVDDYRVRQDLLYREELAVEHRERMAAEMEHRERMEMELELDYREREAAALDYKEKLAVMLEQREREAISMELREREAAELAMREREAAELAMREREAAELAMREREAAELAMREREAGELALREREIAFRAREAMILEISEHVAAVRVMKEREAVIKELQERESILQREREIAELEHRERGSAALRDREDWLYSSTLPPSLDNSGLPLHYRKPTDLDFRKIEANAFNHRDHETLQNNSENVQLELNYRDRVIGDMKMTGAPYMDYSKVGNIHLAASGVQYMEPSNAGETYLKPEHQGAENLKLDFKELKTAIGDYRKRKSLELMSTANKKGAKSMKLLDQEVINVENAEGETARMGNKNMTLLDHQGIKSADSDYRMGKGAYSDYQPGKSADSDYRSVKNADSIQKSGDSDYRAKERGDLCNTNNEKNLKTDSSVSGDLNAQLPAIALKMITSLLANYKKGDTQTQKKENTFLSLNETGTSSGTEKSLPQSVVNPNIGVPHSTKIKVESSHQDPKDGSLYIGANSSIGPGSMDMDFRGRTNRQHESKEVFTKDNKGYLPGTTQKEHCPAPVLGSGDQDMRNKKTLAPASSGTFDQDFRVQSYVQKKDEDLRSGNKDLPGSGTFFNVLDHEAKQQTKKQAADKIKAEVPNQFSKQVKAEDNSTLRSQPTHVEVAQPEGEKTRTGSGSTNLEFLGRQDADYRKKEYKDVDLRIGHGQDKRSADQKFHEEGVPGSKDKDYRRASLPAGATRILWMDGLPAGGSREEIISTLSAAKKLPENDVNLIGYVPGYSAGSVCVEFNLVEDAVRFMDANKGSVIFKGKKVALKYVPSSNWWNCQQCKVFNVLSQERCWQCSALRAGSDLLVGRNIQKESRSPHGKKNKDNRSTASTSSRTESSSESRRSPQDKGQTNKGQQPGVKVTTVIVRGIPYTTCAESVIKVLGRYVQLTPSQIRVPKNRKNKPNKSGITFCFLELKSRKEAKRLTALVHKLNSPLTIDGNPITLNQSVAPKRTVPMKTADQSTIQEPDINTPSVQKDTFVSERVDSHSDERDRRGSKISKREYRKRHHSPSPPRKRKSDDPYSSRKSSEKDESAASSRRGFTEDKWRKGDDQYSSRKSSDKDGSAASSRRGFTEDKRKADEQYSSRKSSGKEDESSASSRRGFREDKVTQNDDPFKKPLPPPIKANTPPPEVNPLIKLLGEYGDDSEEEEEEEQIILPTLKKKTQPNPPAVPPPVVAIPKPSFIAPNISLQEKLTDWKKMACLLCRRQFPTADSLMKHRQMSDLHKKNLAARQKIKLTEKEQKEQEENQSIQRRLHQAKKLLEELEREEKGSQQVPETSPSSNSTYDGTKLTSGIDYFR